MAIKILTAIDSPHGIKITGLIACANEGYRLIPKDKGNGTKVYEVSAVINYYFDRNKLPLFNNNIRINIEPDQINNIYPNIYKYLKGLFPSHENV